MKGQKKIIELTVARLQISDDISNAHRYIERLKKQRAAVEAEIRKIVK